MSPMNHPYTADYLTKFRTAEHAVGMEQRRLARELRMAAKNQVAPQAEAPRRLGLRLRLARLHLPHLRFSA